MPVLVFTTMINFINHIPSRKIKQPNKKHFSLIFRVRPIIYKLYTLSRVGYPIIYPTYVSLNMVINIFAHASANSAYAARFSDELCTQV